MGRDFSPDVGRAFRDHVGRAFSPDVKAPFRHTDNARRSDQPGVVKVRTRSEPGSPSPATLVEASGCRAGIGVGTGAGRFLALPELRPLSRKHGGSRQKTPPPAPCPEFVPALYQASYGTPEPCAADHSKTSEEAVQRLDTLAGQLREAGAEEAKVELVAQLDWVHEGFG